jgi:hypothetical protein
MIFWFVEGMLTITSFPGTPASSTNITDRLDIAEILLKVALDNIDYQNS